MASAMKHVLSSSSIEDDKQIDNRKKPHKCPYEGCDGTGNNIPGKMRHWSIKNCPLARQADTVKKFALSNTYLK